MHLLNSDKESLEQSLWENLRNSLWMTFQKKEDSLKDDLFCKSPLEMRESLSQYAWNCFAANSKDLIRRSVSNNADICDWGMADV